MEVNTLKNIAIDTNRMSDFFRGEESIKLLLRLPKQIYIPYIVVAELRAGFLCGKKSLENERALVRFFASPRVEILYPNEDTTHHYARLFHQLRTQGTPIPMNALWIVALCVQHDLPLISRDRHFVNVPQLNLI